MERCTIIVGARDRFSTTVSCLETLIANTPQPYDLVVVMGGAPQSLQDELKQRFGHQAKLLFSPNFVNQAKSRNIGLREAKTRLAVVLDNDVYVRPGWLAPLLQCHQETNAAVVVPLILEAPHTIHAAGNMLYVTYEHGKSYIRKEHSFYNMDYAEGCNLTRRRVDYGEFHCLLVEAKLILESAAFDEQLDETWEVDAGLTVGKAGREVWCEPSSVVYYALSSPIRAEDIRLFMWRWDMRTNLDTCRNFEKKWNMDIAEQGAYREYLLWYNNRIGLLPRLFPSEVSLWVSRGIGDARSLLVNLFESLRRPLRFIKAWRLGYFAWVESTPSERGNR